MGDIANILGVQAKAVLSAGEAAQAILAGPNPIPENRKKMKKPKGMSREVFDLMGPGGLIPAVLMSHYTGIKMHTLDVRLRDGDGECETNCWMAEDASNGKKILVLDDINDTGETFKWIVKDWEGSVVDDIDWGNTVRFAAIIDNVPSEMDVEYSSMEINKLEDPSWIVFPFEEWW